MLPGGYRVRPRDLILDLHARRRFGGLRHGFRHGGHRLAALDRRLRGRLRLECAGGGEQEDYGNEGYPPGPLRIRAESRSFHNVSSQAAR